MRLFLFRANMRRSFSISIALLLAFTSLGFGQSGRRAEPKPSPSPIIAKDDPTQYSESKPLPTRRMPQLGDTRIGSKPMPTTRPGDTEASDDETLRVDTKLITIPVSVYDRAGLYVPGLTKDNFTIFDNGKQQEVAYFGVDDKPFTVVLMLDTSMSATMKIEDMQRAAIAFVDMLQPRDSVMVIEFNGDIKVRTEATNDREKIYKAIRKANWDYGTSLYDAVDVALRKKLSQIQGRKAIVLFTDGVDTSSRKSSYDKTLNMAEESDALIFPIYYDTFIDNQRMGGPFIVRGNTAAEYRLGRQYLDDLATYTGGRVFRPEATPGGITAAFEGIAEELRRQYNIGFIPSEDGKPGEQRRIRVRVDRPNLVVRARDSYTIGSSLPN